MSAAHDFPTHFADVLDLARLPFYGLSSRSLIAGRMG